MFKVFKNESFRLRHIGFNFGKNNKKFLCINILKILFKLIEFLKLKITSIVFTTVKK